VSNLARKYQTRPIAKSKEIPSASKNKSSRIIPQATERKINAIVQQLQLNNKNEKPTYK